MSGVPRSGGGPESTERGAIFAPVWRELKLLEPLIFVRTNMSLNLFNYLTNRVCTAEEKKGVNVCSYAIRG